MYFFKNSGATNFFGALGEEVAKNVGYLEKSPFKSDTWTSFKVQVKRHLDL